MFPPKILANEQFSNLNDMKYILELDNPGRGGCLFYAFTIGLMPILQAEINRPSEGTPTLDKLSEALQLNTAEQGSENFLKIQDLIRKFNIEKPDKSTLDIFNKLLRNIVYEENVKDLETYIDGKAPGIPKTLSDAQALFEYYYNEKEGTTALQETDIAANYNIQMEIKKAVKQYKQTCVQPSELYFTDEVFNKWSLCDPIQKKTLLSKALQLCEFKEGSQERNALIQDLQKQFESNPQAIKLVEIYIDYINSPPSSRTFLQRKVKSYIEDGRQSLEPSKEYPMTEWDNKNKEEFDTISEILNADPIPEDLRTQIEKELRNKNVNVHASFLERLAKLSELTPENKREIIDKAISLFFEKGIDKLQLRFIINGIATDNGSEVSLLKQLFKQKLEVTQWGTAESAGRLAGYFDVGLLTSSTDATEPHSSINILDADGVKRTNIIVLRNQPLQGGFGKPNHWVTHFSATEAQYDQYNQAERMKCNDSTTYLQSSSDEACSSNKENTKEGLNRAKIYECFCSYEPSSLLTWALVDTEFRNRRGREVQLKNDILLLCKKPGEVEELMLDIQTTLNAYLEAGHNLPPKLVSGWRDLSEKWKGTSVVLGETKNDEQPVADGDDDFFIVPSKLNGGYIIS